MIANRGRERMIGSSDFDAAVMYIARDGPQHEREHELPLAVWYGNVASLDTAALEMTATASQSRAQDPLYHLIVSWDEGEQPTYEQARAALDAQMQHLGFTGLQYAAALQNDGVGGKYHLHAVINRVDPVTYVARVIWQDHERMQAACREVELEQGWRIVVSPQGRGLSRGARDAEYSGLKQSFERRVREEFGPALRTCLERDGVRWEHLHAFFRERGARYDPVMRGNAIAGGRITGTARGEFARARDLGEDLTHRKLVERLGAYEPDRVAAVRLPFSERCRSAAVEVAALRSFGDAELGWAQVHAVFDRHGLAYETVGTGARIGDLDGPESVKASVVDRALSMSAMRKRFGVFETTAQARERAAAREAVRVASSLVVGARLIEDPSPILERLTATRATFRLRDAERVIGEKVRDPEQRQAVLKAVVAKSVTIADEQGRLRLTTAAVLEAEHRLDAAARGLALAALPTAIDRPAGAHLDEQQLRAYAYATADDARLKVVTGVPGAGKTTLIAEVAAAYEAAGYRVRAVSVANAAVQVLERETRLPARSVAKELYEWGQGREELGARDVLIVDEVSTLGTAQGAELLEAAHERGATVLVFGDDKQFQAVAHGNALAFLQRSVGEKTIDLTETRRQREAWQRDATHAVRRGEVRVALDAYREHGCVREHETQAQARTALVDRWEEIERGEIVCGMEAFTNAERIAVNELARERWRSLGRLSGGDTELETIDGRVPYAVGDRVVIRETIREAGLFNGSVGTVCGVSGVVLEVERRDGATVRVDTSAHPGVQHGYCSTEYREQGSTRYAELQLVTGHVNQRSLTVGMTRHTHTYEMFYARETVGSYEDLVGLGMRTRSKDVASDYRIQAPLRSVRSIEHVREELQRGVHRAVVQARSDERLMPQVLDQCKRHEAIEARLRVLVERGVREIALEPLGKGNFSARLVQVERTLHHLERGNPLSKPVVPEPASQKLAGYDLLRLKLAEREKALTVRSAALAREETALGYVTAPMPLARRVHDAEEAIRCEVEKATAFTTLERQRLNEARAQQGSWNPLVRAQGERTERELQALQAERHDRALQAGMERFSQVEKPRLAEVFQRQSEARADWVARASQLVGEQRKVHRELNEVGIVWAELDEMQRSGAPALAPGKVLSLSGEWRAALHEAFSKSETFALSMCQRLKSMARGESITGKLAFKHELPSGQALVLIDDGNGTLHRGIVRNVGDVRSGAKVTLEINRAARVTLSLGLEQSRGRGMRR